MAEDKEPKPKIDNTLPPNAIVVNEDLLKPKKYTFQIVGSGGGHYEPHPLRDDDGKLILIPVLWNNQPEVRGGKPVLRIQTKDVKYGPKNCPAGSIIETNLRLDKIHNTKVSTRFMLLDKDHNPHAVELGEEKRRANKLAVDRANLLQRMSVVELREYAESEGIDVKNTSKKDDLLRYIAAAQRELAAA